MKSRLFWIYQRSHIFVICPKVEQISILLSSLHHESAIFSNSGNTKIIEFYNKTTVAIDTLDPTFARYSTVQRANRKWTMAMFYDMINIFLFAIIGYNPCFINTV
jgi:hypothetical protein